MNADGSCAPVSSGAFESLHSDTRHQDPSRRESEQHRHKNRKEVIYLDLLHLASWGSPYSIFSSSSFFIPTISPTFSFETAWRPCNARSRPSSPRSYRNEILAMSRPVLGARRLRTKHYELISRATDSMIFGSDSEPKCNGRTR